MVLYIAHVNLKTIQKVNKKLYPFLDESDESTKNVTESEKDDVLSVDNNIEIIYIIAIQSSTKRQMMS